MIYIQLTCNITLVTLSSQNNDVHAMSVWLSACAKAQLTAIYKLTADDRKATTIH